MKHTYRDEDIEGRERMLSEKFGRKVIILDGRYNGAMVLPPSEGHPETASQTGCLG